jgi:hypothetical protein
LAGGAGLLCIVVGTFLPWLHSGSHTRNSYGADGAARRLLGVHGVGAAFLTIWPFVVFACAAALAAGVLGWRRIAAVIAVLAACGAAAGAITMLTAGHSAVLQPANAGPIVTFVGSVVVVAAVTMHRLILTRHQPKERR